MKDELGDDILGDLVKVMDKSILVTYKYRAKILKLDRDDENLDVNLVSLISLYKKDMEEVGKLS
tara:strand:- start:5094 stop:5285 length:192 start_codon:yes stop_codon:yes gene_type:complete